MSQTIRNAEGETVEVLTKSDLNRWLWGIVVALSTALGIVVPIAWHASEAVAQQDARLVTVERDVAAVKATYQQFVELSRQMDSLRISLNATAHALEQAR